MKKARFTKQHLIFITPDMDQRLHELTLIEEISMAEFVRDAIKRKFAIIDAQMWEHKFLTGKISEEEFELHKDDVYITEEDLEED